MPSSSRTLDCGQMYSNSCVSKRYAIGSPPACRPRALHCSVRWLQPFQSSDTTSKWEYKLEFVCHICRRPKYPPPYGCGSSHSTEALPSTSTCIMPWSRRTTTSYTLDRPPPIRSTPALTILKPGSRRRLAAHNPCGVRSHIPAPFFPSCQFKANV